MSESDSKNQLPALVKEAPLLAVSEPTNEDQIVVLNRAIEISGKNTDIMTLAQLPLRSQLLRAHLPKGGFVYPISEYNLSSNLRANVGKFNPDQIKEIQTIYPDSKNFKCKTDHSVYGGPNEQIAQESLIAETREELEAIVQDYYGRIQERDQLPDMGIGKNEWGGVNLDNFDETVEHVLSRFDFLFFALGEDGWVPEHSKDEALLRSELFHPALLKMIPLNDLMESLKTIYAPAFQFEGETQVTMLNALRKAGGKKVSEFLNKQTPSIKALTHVAEARPVLATRALEAIQTVSPKDLAKEIADAAAKFATMPPR